MAQLTPKAEWDCGDSRLGFIPHRLELINPRSDFVRVKFGHPAHGVTMKPAHHPCPVDDTEAAIFGKSGE